MIRLSRRIADAQSDTILFALIFRDKLRVDGDLQGGRGDVASLGTPDRRSQTVVA